MVKMLKIVLSAVAISMVGSCSVWVNSPNDPDLIFDTTDPPIQPQQPSHPKTPITTAMYFPFQDNTNWWRYTESGSNRVSIDVTDTISDDNVMYYRVSFKENRVDTTDDWFKTSKSGIMFGPSLAGSYSLFLPAKLDSMSGTFYSGQSRIQYAYKDTMRVSGRLFKGIITLTYSSPVLHGFSEIVFADSVGVVQLKDGHGRWPVIYSIDSCSVYGDVKVY
jgi:hypothetical protein